MRSLSGLKEVVSLGRRAYQVFALAGRVLFSEETALLEQIRQQQNDFSVASVQLVDRLEQLRLLDLTSKELRQIAELLWVTARDPPDWAVCGRCRRIG